MERAQATKSADLATITKSSRKTQPITPVSKAEHDGEEIMATVWKRLLGGPTSP
jgi:hypothetical protein